MAEKHGTGGKAMVNLAKRAKRLNEKVIAIYFTRLSCLVVHVSLRKSTFPARFSEVWV